MNDYADKEWLRTHKPFWHRALHLIWAVPSVYAVIFGVLS